MQVTLVSHASVIVRTDDAQIWTDPWLLGAAFNNSWALHPSACFAPTALQTIDFLWLSHEHPDHFHVPTLKSLPKEFKERVVVLFQRNNSDKMFAALKLLGFVHFRALPHRAKVQLSPRTAVYCYQQGQINSALGVLHDGQVVFNINDAELSRGDCRLIRRDIGAPNVVLNQFSLAGYGGYVDYETRLPQQATVILSTMLQNHRDLHAGVTIPIASFMYFSHADNRYLNAFANHPSDVVRQFGGAAKDVAVLYPGDTYTVDAAHASEAALERYRQALTCLDSLPYAVAEPVPLDAIAIALQKRSAQLRQHFPMFVLRRLKPVVARIVDLATCVEFCVVTGAIRDATGEAPGLEIKSQALEFCFLYPYGVQTLGVSGRYRLLCDYGNWRRHRVVFAMENAEVYLKARYLLTRRMLGYVRDRFNGAAQQLSYALQRLEQ